MVIQVNFIKHHRLYFDFIILVYFKYLTNYFTIQEHFHYYYCYYFVLIRYPIHLSENYHHFTLAKELDQDHFQFNTISLNLDLILLDILLLIWQYIHHIGP